MQNDRTVCVRALCMAFHSHWLFVFLSLQIYLYYFHDYCSKYTIYLLFIISERWNEAFHIVSFALGFSVLFFFTLSLSLSISFFIQIMRRIGQFLCNLERFWSCRVVLCCVVSCRNTYAHTYMLKSKTEWNEWFAFCSHIFVRSFIFLS